MLLNIELAPPCIAIKPLTPTTPTILSKARPNPISWVRGSSKLTSGEVVAQMYQMSWGRLVMSNKKYRKIIAKTSPEKVSTPP